MIIGTGLLASVFDASEVEAARAIVFASGVSNSLETRPAAFEREEVLLRNALGNVAGPFVYFSTCSVSDLSRWHSPYVQHKLAMEEMVRASRRHFVLRLPQVVGKTSNPHTLTNYLANRIMSGTQFEIWRNAIRCILDVDAVASATMLLLRDEARCVVADLAPPEVVTMLELVQMMQSALGREASYSQMEQGGGPVPSSDLLVSMAPNIGLDLSPGYTRRTIHKYYGHPSAN